MQRVCWPRNRTETPRASTLRAAQSALAGLGEAAVAVTQVLSLQPECLPLEVVVEAARIDGKQAVVLIDRLSRLGILRVLDDHTWLVNDELRRTIAQRMGEAERRAGHLRVGKSLLERGYGGGEKCLLVAASLMRGGDEETGEALIARAVEVSDLGPCSVHPWQRRSSRGSTIRHDAPRRRTRVGEILDLHHCAG